MKKMSLIIMLILFCNISMSWGADELVGFIKSIDLKTRKIYISKSTGDTSANYSTDTKWPEGTTDASDWAGKEVTISFDKLSKLVSEVEGVKEKT